MHVAVLFEYPTLNGGEQSILTAFSRLRDQIQITALAPAEGPLQEALKDASINHVPFSLRDRHGVKRSPESLLREWNQLVPDHGIDLIHANSLSMCRHLGRAAPALVVPATGHIRDIMKLKPKAIRDLNNLVGIVAVSHATRDFHVNQGLSAETCSVIYNGVHTDRFAPSERTGCLHQELGLPANAKLAATIGQICLRKGQVDLAHAATHIKDRLQNLHYLLIGQRHSSKAESVAYDEEINTIFANAGMSDRLHRLGYRDDIPNILNEVDLLIHPARQEPLGRVLLEAAAAGTPIVATDVGGTAEILRDGESARLFPVGSIESLGIAIQQTFESAAQSRSMAENARDDVAERFNINSQCVELLQFWQAALSNTCERSSDSSPLDEYSS